MSKDLFDEVIIELDESIMDEYTNEFERSINKVLDKHQTIDSRAELLMTLILFSAQIGLDIGMIKENFAELSNKMFDQVEKQPLNINAQAAKKDNFGDN